jgi:hypothetical protein
LIEHRVELPHAQQGQRADQGEKAGS